MKKLIAALIIGFFLTLFMADFSFRSTEAAISESVIRLHVIANSNSCSDQNLKLKVRDRILKDFSHSLNKDGTVSAARKQILENIDSIEACAIDEIRKNGFDYPVKVSLGKSDFPTKEYGDLILPAGSYEALKIEIGNANGKNWWCVLFPPLCFVNESCVTTDSSSVEKIEESVGKENSELINKNKSENAQIRFKIYEMWQSGKKKLAMLFE